MSIPIRCFSCGKVLGNKYEIFNSYKDKQQAFIDLKIERYCCKNILLTSIDTEDLLSGYDKFPESITLKEEKAVSIHLAR